MYSWKMQDVIKSIIMVIVWLNLQASKRDSFPVMHLLLQIFPSLEKRKEGKACRMPLPYIICVQQHLWAPKTQTQEILVVEQRESRALQDSCEYGREEESGSKWDAAWSRVHEASLQHSCVGNEASGKHSQIWQCWMCPDHEIKQS